MSVSLADFLLLRKNLRIVDVRSEGEYEAGHIVAACNVPLLNNEERAIVGTAYKRQGQQIAIMEGFRLVGPRLYELIRSAQAAAVKQELLAYCWRGGMRSNNFQQFMAMAGVKVQTLSGGYKSYRTAVQQSFNAQLNLTLLTGYTGSGKSEVLRELKRLGEQVIDLEELAKHRGSAFGGLLMPAQPTTEQFENNLFEVIHKLDPAKRIWIEDESIAVGRIFLPQALWQQMSQSPIVSLQVDKQVRVRRLAKEYGAAPAESFLFCMSQIVKKLGGQHYEAAKGKYLAGDLEAAIDIILVYYDKAYQTAIARRSSRIIEQLSWDGFNAGEMAGQLVAAGNK